MPEDSTASAAFAACTSAAAISYSSTEALAYCDRRSSRRFTERCPPTREMNRSRAANSELASEGAESIPTERQFIFSFETQRPQKAQRQDRVSRLLNFLGALCGLCVSIWKSRGDSWLLRSERIAREGARGEADRDARGGGRGGVIGLLGTGEPQRVRDQLPRGA